MSEFAGNWPKQHLEQKQQTQSGGFGLAGFVATGAVLAVLAGFGAIAMVAGGAPKGSGTVVSGASLAKAAVPVPVPDPDADAPARKTDGGKTSRNDQAAADNSGEPVLPMAQAESQALAPAAVRTYKVEPDGRIVGDDIAALAADDPRWAQDSGSSATNGKRALARLLLDNEGKPEANRDNPLTSAIAPVDRSMEASPREKTANSGAPARAGKTGYARQYVNMRAGPSNGAKVIEVIPAKARVTIHGCKGWCEISHEGRRGFVYKSFIRQG